MKQYLDLINDVVQNGAAREYRNGARCSVFGKQLCFDLSEGFPLVTVKKTNHAAAFDEIIFFLKGQTNIDNLLYKNTWKQWSLVQSDLDSTDIQYPVGTVGDIGSIYGREYRHATNNGVPIKQAYCNNPSLGIAPDVKKKLRELHGDWYDDNEDKIQLDHLRTSVDQVWELVQNLKSNPASTRHRIAIYNPEYVPDESLSPQDNIMLGKGSLTPCTVFQQYTTMSYGDTHKLSLHITLASSDVLVGLCYNIAQFAMLLSIIAKATNMIPYMLYINIGDAHVYLNQMEALNESDLLTRKPRELSTLLINPKVDIWDLKHDDFRMVNYSHHPFIMFPVST